MEKTILEGKWKQIRGKSKVWWSKLTDNDLDRIGGKFEILVEVLQEKYGFSRRNAVQKICQRVITYRTSQKFSNNVMKICLLVDNNTSSEQ